jgi:hypothetical protein
MERTFLRAVVTVAGQLLPLSLLAQTGPFQSTTFAYAGIGHSFMVLGSRDVRDGQQLGAHRIAVEPRLGRYQEHFRPVETIYLMRHTGEDKRYGSTQVEALGAMYGLRSVFGPSDRYFLEYSFGLQVDSTRSHGVPSEGNVTPVFELGETTGGRRPVEIGLQLMHISNGYTQRPNFGLDFATLLVGFKV